MKNTRRVPFVDSTPSRASRFRCSMLGDSREE